MNLFIARQAIFDREGTVYGYKLLYREADSEHYSCVNGDLATSSVIAGNFLSSTLQSMTGGKKSFINFTQSFLTKDIATLFPPEHLVIEVLETPDSGEVIMACERLKKLGYTLCVGDFALKPGYAGLLQLADIVKVDFLQRSDQEKQLIIKRLSGGGRSFMAEKVETREEYQKGLEWGYHYFQGYFFAKPEKMSSATIHPSKLSQIRLISAVNEPSVDFKRIAEIIEMDTAFSYEILRIVNSTYFSRGTKIKNIKQALIRLGLDDVKKWCYITALRKQTSDTYNEVIAVSMIRAKFLESIAALVGGSASASDYITVGILSSLDVLLGASMEVILKEMHLAEEINNVLLGLDTVSHMAQCYRLIVECEQGNWLEVGLLADELKIDIGQIAEMHNEAIKWVVKFDQELAQY